MKLLTLTILTFLISPTLVFAASLNIYPNSPIQGDPIIITVTEIGISPTTMPPTVFSISFAGKNLPIISYQNTPTAIYGFDINKTAGVYVARAHLSDGTVIQKTIIVGARKKAEVAFTIPAKLGGNTATSQQTLSTTLADENTGLLGLRTGTKFFWTAPFQYPVINPVVTDTYGYSRLTGQTTITHKGVDFHAPLGTPVASINRGVARLVRQTRNYGKTIVVDHGFGLMSMYMHLSKIYVNEGELVQKGQTIGLSGQTGYAESPHLHLTIRINDISIDPIPFLNFFK